MKDEAYYIKAKRSMNAMNMMYKNLDQSIISRCYQLYQSSLVLRVVWWYISFFIHILIEHSVRKQ